MFRTAISTTRDQAASPHPFGSLWLLVALFAWIGLGATGCERPQSIDLEEWTLYIRHDGDAPSPRDGPKSPSTDSGRRIRLPIRLDNLLPRHHAQFLLVRYVDLPPKWRNRKLRLAIPFLPSLARLRVNGVPIQSSRLEQFDHYRSYGPVIWDLGAPETPRLKLELIIEHTWSQSAWLSCVPRILPAESRDPVLTLAELQRPMALIALAVQFQMAIFFFVVFWMGRQRRSYFWFALLSVSGAAFPGDVYSLGQLMYGEYDMFFLASGLLVSVIASLNFTHAYFDLGPPSRLWYIAAAVIFCIGVAAPGPFDAPRYVVPLASVLIGLATLYQIFLTFRQYRREGNSRGALWQLAAWCLLLVGVGPEISGWTQGTELLGGVRLGVFGLTAFGVLFAMMLGTQHTEKLNETESLNLELEGKVEQLRARRDEIEQLNTQMRHQIADRSRQLFSVLASGDRGREAIELDAGSIINGRYRVRREVGSGGMGTVFEVERLTDRRPFALKVAHGLDSSHLARLAREAQIISQVAHPNVIRISDVDVSEGGYLYFVMELIEGRSLRDEDQRFGDARWALPIIAQVARGLEMLHNLGIVHRDLKPANVLLSLDENRRIRATIADFGVSRMALGADVAAKLRYEALPPPPAGTESAKGNTEADHTTVGSVPRIESANPTHSDRRTAAPIDRKQALDTDEGHPFVRSPASSPSRAITVATPRSARAARAARSSSTPRHTLTAPGQVSGTPGYMAPEVPQQPNEHRPSADIFSLGVMAYELLVGRRPFATTAFFVRPGHECPFDAIDTLRSDLAAEVVSVIERCLAFDPEQRPSADELARVIEAQLAKT
ncbi:MAG: protein kinase [Myxococcales bacterium]|nr:protein kinase [Myxococcales bacterium]